ncbi:hypothetical protein [Aeromonas salmonicida]|uniref:hypothetical protein n=1 Tax=Aeromonas salmonicida TaxID=645 RepID=UPI00259E411F|nr:hypothetical protein [Aeromonas salmonicida]MDM5128661.1 hypothetical protein [Aeromonas salmonicida]
MYRKVILRERGVMIGEEYPINHIPAPHVMAPVTMYKPSLPTRHPHPLVEYGIRENDLGELVAYWQTDSYNHEFHTEFLIEVNGIVLDKFNYFFK